jgi:hypothetical protein
LWKKKYGREGVLTKRVKAETVKETDELKAAKARIRELEAALAGAYGLVFGKRVFGHSLRRVGCRRPSDEPSCAALPGFF